MADEFQRMLDKLKPSPVAKAFAAIRDDLRNPSPEDKAALREAFAELVEYDAPTAIGVLGFVESIHDTMTRGLWDLVLHMFALNMQRYVPRMLAETPKILADAIRHVSAWQDRFDLHLALEDANERFAPPEMKGGH